MKEELVIVADIKRRTVGMAIEHGPKACDMVPVPWLKDIPMNFDAMLSAGWKIVIVG